MTNGGPNHKSETAVTYMYYIMFKSGKYSYGSAMAVVVLVACMIFTLIYTPKHSGFFSETVLVRCNTNKAIKIILKGKIKPAQQEL